MRFPCSTAPASTPLGDITGQYCGRLLKFSAHSLNVLGIRYKVCFSIDNIIYTYIQDHFSNVFFY